MDNQTTNQGLPNVAGEEAIAKFAGNLIEEKGLTNLSSEQKATLQHAIEEKLVELVNQAIIYAMPEDKFEELEKMVDRDDANEEEIVNLITNSGVDLQKIATEVMTEFRQAYLADKRGEA